MPQTHQIDFEITNYDEIICPKEYLGTFVEFFKQICNFIEFWKLKWLQNCIKNKINYWKPMRTNPPTFLSLIELRECQSN